MQYQTQAFPRSGKRYYRLSHPTTVKWIICQIAMEVSHHGGEIGIDRR